MHGFHQHLSWLVAQAQAQAPAQGQAPANEPSPYMLPMMLFGFALFFYILFVRPQRQEEQKRRAQVAALKKNDKVVTTGGIFGTVTSVETDHVVLRVDDEKGTKIKFARASVARMLDAASEKEKEKGAESSGS